MIQSLALNSLPVSPIELSEERYTKTGAMSDGVGRVIGSSPGTAAALMSVLVPPGFTELTLMLNSLSSWDNIWVKASIPNFETE